MTMKSPQANDENEKKKKEDKDKDKNVLLCQMSSQVVDRGEKRQQEVEEATTEPSANKHQLSTRKWKEEKEEEKEECQSAAAAAVWRVSLLTSAPCLVTTEALRDRQADMDRGRKQTHKRIH